MNKDFLIRKIHQNRPKGLEICAVLCYNIQNAT